MNNKIHIPSCRSVLFIITGVSNAADLNVVIDNINAQKNITKNIVVVTDSAINIDLISNHQNSKLSLHLIRHEDLTVSLLNIIRDSQEEYVSFWFKNQWSHTNRIELQLKQVERTYKLVCILNYTLMYDVELDIAAVSPRFLNFTTALWEKQYLYHLGHEGIQLAIGKNLDVSPDALKKLSPLAMPYLMINFDEYECRSRAPYYQYLWDSFIPVDEKLSALIRKVKDVNINTDKLSKSLGAAKAIIEYSLSRGNVFL
jgi:hypothetical protein